MIEQFAFLIQDLKRIVGKKYYRWLIVFFTRSFFGVFLYRLERAGFLLFGKYYNFMRLPFIPLFVLLQSFSNIDIHYKANIKGGILILHPSLGVVISGRAIIGKNLTLTGGNTIGLNASSKEASFFIGNSCEMGANAVIIGPVIIADNCTIGASACVTKSFILEKSILVGVPAKCINNKI
jgi:serine acetyltransferase